MFTSIFRSVIAKLPFPEFVILRLLSMFGLASISLTSLPFIISALVFYYLYKNANKEHFLLK